MCALIEMCAFCVLRSPSFSARSLLAPLPRRRVSRFSQFFWSGRAPRLMSRFFVLVTCACVALCAAQDLKALENALSFAFTAYCGSGVSRVACFGLL
jgi:hypothetical protein